MVQTAVKQLMQIQLALFPNMTVHDLKKKRKKENNTSLSDTEFVNESMTYRHSRKVSNFSPK